MEELKNDSEIHIKEINAEVDGKKISKQGVKDITCSSNCLFMTTGKYIM